MGDGNQELPTLAPGAARIVIDYNPHTGEVAVAGPTDIPTMFLGMLETAKMVLFELRAEAARKAARPNIEIPGRNDIPGVGLDLSQITGRG